MTRKVGAWVMLLPQAKAPRRLWAVLREPGRRWTGPPHPWLGPPREPACRHLDLRLPASGTGRPHASVI